MANGRGAGADPAAAAQAQQQGQAAAQGGAEGGQGGPEQLQSLIQNLGTGMQMLSEVISAAGVSPQLSERAQKVQAEFEGLVQDISQVAGGGQAGGQQPQRGGQGAVAQEAGGAAVRPAFPG